MVFNHGAISTGTTELLEEDFLCCSLYWKVISFRDFHNLATNYLSGSGFYSRKVKLTSTFLKELLFIFLSVSLLRHLQIDFSPKMSF